MAVTPNLGLELFTPQGIVWREDSTAGVISDYNMMLIDAAVGKGGGGTPGGGNTQIQYNNSGKFAGDPSFTFIPNTGVALTSGTVIVTDNATYSGQGMVNGIVGAFEYLWTTGLPAASPIAAAGQSSFDIARTFTQVIALDQNNSVGLSVGVQATPTGPVSVGSYAGSEHTVFIPASNTQSINQIQGIITNAINNGSGSANVAALSAWAVQNNPAATATVLLALDGEALNYGGSVTYQEALYAYSDCYAGTVTNNYGVFIASPSPTGTITNNYGLYIDDQTQGGTHNPNPYALYSAGGRNYFAGSVILKSTLVDGTSAVGTNGQVLSSTVTGTKWVAATPLTTLGDIIYENATPAPTRLAGNTSATKMFLTQTGTGSISAAPAWGALASGDIPNNAANTSGTAANLSGTPALPNGTTATTQTAGDNSAKIATDAFVNAAVTTGVAIAVTAAELNAAGLYIPLATMTTNGDMIYENASLGPVRLPIGTVGQVLTSNGSDPVWGSPVWNIEGNATGNLTLANAGFSSTFNQTSAVTWTWANTTPATVSAAQSSPILTLSGQYWTGAASAQDSWTIQDVIAAGTNGTSQLTFGHAGSSGASTVLFNVAGGIRVSATNGLSLSGATNGVIQTLTGGTNLTLSGLINGQANASVIVLQNGSTFSNSATPNGIVNINATFGSTGTFAGFGLSVTPTINQTGSGAAPITVIAGYTVNTAILGTIKLLGLGHTTASGVGGTFTDEFVVLKGGTISTYNSIATVSNGVPSEIATVDLTAQAAAIAATTLYTPTATGMYRISVYLKVTTAASTSSTLGGLTITYTDGSDSVAQSVVAQLGTAAGASATSISNGTTTSVLQGEVLVYALTAVAIKYAVAYASSGTTAMAYEVHLKCEAM